MKKGKKTNFHGNQEVLAKKYHRALNRAVEDEVLTQDEANLVKTFVSEVTAQKNISHNRKYVIANTIIMMRKFLSDYRECKTEDIFSAIEDYRSTTEHEPSYQKTILTTFKQFLTWLIETESNTVLKPARIAKININLPIDLKSEQDILTGGELKKMFSAMKTLKDRAFIEVLYESGGRINEVAKLKWEQIELSGNHAVIVVQSKTDKQRKIPLYTSSLVLKQWMHQYPTGVAPDKCVFYGRASDPYQPMVYQTTVKIIKNGAKAAGITKNVYAHMFRHTRITDLLRQGIPEQTIKMMMWGTITSEMLKIYAHLTPTDAINDMNTRMGIETEYKSNPLPDVATPVQCGKCFAINSKDHRFCGLCGNPLSDGVSGAHAIGFVEAAKKLIANGMAPETVCEILEISKSDLI